MSTQMKSRGSWKQNLLTAKSIEMREVMVFMKSRKVMNPGDLRRAMQELSDGKHLLTFKDLRKRSIPQNSYYWAVIVPLVRRGLYEIGYDEVKSDEDAHEIVKGLFIKKQLANHLTGEVIEFAGSTKELTVPEFNELIERVIKWAAEYLGIVIPSPNQELPICI